MSKKRCSDQELIDLRNSKLSNSEIAKRLGVHKSNVTRRLKKLAREGVPSYVAIGPKSVGRELLEIPEEEQTASIQRVLACAKADLDHTNEIIERNRYTAGPSTTEERERQKLQVQRDRLILEALKSRSYGERDVAIINNALSQKVGFQKFVDIFLEEVRKVDQATRDRIAVRLAQMRDKLEKDMRDQVSSRIN